MERHLGRQLGWILALLAGTALPSPAPARGDDASPAASPPPPPAPPAGPSGQAPAPPPPPPAPTPAAPTQPPPPPPPEIEVPGWDMWFGNRQVGLPPPLPPKDPFDGRPIQFRHDREVSADGRIMELKRIPQWVDVLDRGAIEEWRPQSFGEMLRRMPNVMIGDAGSPYLALPVIRSLGGDRVKILTDGVWPSTQALGVAGGTLSLWDPESTERVEVYHGPGAYLRGVDAGGGVINIVPRRPSRHECFEAWGEAATSYDSATSRFRERLGAEMGQGRVAALLGATYEDDGDRDTAGGTLDPSTYHWFAGDLALDYFLDNQSTIGITGQFVRAEDVQSPLGVGSSFTQPRYQRTFLGLTMSSFDVGSVFHGSRMSIAFDQFLNDDDATTPLSLTSGVSSQDKATRFDYHLQGNLYLAPCHDTWAELSVSYAHLVRQEEILPPTTRGNPIPEGRSGDGVVFPTAVPGQPVPGTAKYVANEWDVKGLIQDETHSDCWDTIVGASVEWYHIQDDRSGQDKTDWTFAVAGGAARHLCDCLTLYGNASYGQRHPSLYESFDLAVLDGILVFPNPDLSDETSVAGEVGVKYAWFNKATLQADVFAHWIGDYIGRRPVGADQVWDNVGDVTLYGAELTGAWRPDPCRCEGLEYFGMLGATGSSDEGIVHDTPIHGRVGARYSWCTGPKCGVRRWFVEGAVRGASNSTHADGTGGDAFATAEILSGVGWSSGGRRTVWATLGVTNLLDRDYTEPFARLPAAGRSLIASVSVDF